MTDTGAHLLKVTYLNPLSMPPHFPFTVLLYKHLFKTRPVRYRYR